MRTTHKRTFRRYLPSVAGGAIALAGLLLLASHDAAMMHIQRVLAVASSGILNLFGQDTVVVGTTVQSNLFGITVVTACTGLFITGLFLVAVMAFPTRWRSKAIGVGIGIGGIFVVNIVRLVSLYFIGIHWPGFLDAAHQLVWQSLLIVVAVALWLLWAGRWAYAHAPQ